MSYIFLKNNKSRIVLILPIILLLFLLSCKKFVEVDPPKTELVNSVVFSNDASAKSAMDGVYSRMMSSNGFASGASLGITFLCGGSSDELINYSTAANSIEFYSNSLQPTNGTLLSLWNEPFQLIYSANSILEGLNNAPNVSAPIKSELIGEAKFIRAFCYFYLINLFGDVPLHLATDYRITSIASRSPKEQVYQQIISDLKDAQNHLKNDYSFSNGERVRPNMWAATALLARVYLYTVDWSNAEAQATAVISNTVMYDTVSLSNGVFNKNSKEAIWQLMPNQPGFNTNEGRYFILTSAPTIATMNSQLLSAFDTTDNRRINWVKSVTVASNVYNFPFKYKIQSGATLSEYSMVLRFGELYLIRAEARAQQNNLTDAKNDLNVIRKRAGLQNTTAITQSELLEAIMKERQVELFAEWGHRWLDLKRSNKANAVMSTIKGSNWQNTDVLYPIPLQEIQNNSSITQNLGYQ
jgi:hypothetical protein